MSKNIEKNENKKNDISKKVKIIPLGGVQEIGKNCTIIEYNNEMILVDVGLAFPDETMPGADIVIPNFSYVKKNVSNLKGIVLTHGHEDHIGALPYFFKSMPKGIPVYGSDFTLGVVKEKLKSKFKDKRFNLNIVANRSRVELGKYFHVEFIYMTHSIPGAFVVAIHTPEGVIVHTGDYKFDLTPVDGNHVDFFKLAEIGEKGAILLLSDSTNSNKDGFTASEMQVSRSMYDVFLKAKGRIIISVFSSHAHRVQEIIKTAFQFGRKVILEGRSMTRSYNVGSETGSIVIPDGVVINQSELSGTEAENLVVVCTGTQGEVSSAMTRIAIGEHKNLKIEENDTVIMSANSIPGNEVSINRVVNLLNKKGAIVYHHGQSGLHVSGHGCKGDIALMLNLIKPKFFMPVHGEYMHLIGSKRLAMDVGMQPNNVIITKNGDIVVLDKDSIYVHDTIDSSGVAIDNNNLSDIDSSTLKDRISLSKDGVIIAHIVVNKTSKKLEGHPEIISKGVGYHYIVKELVQDIVLTFGDKEISSLKDFRQIVKDHIRKVVKRQITKNPLVIVVISNS
jgi:ribonuclease J